MLGNDSLKKFGVDIPWTVASNWRHISNVQNCGSLPVAAILKSAKNRVHISLLPQKFTNSINWRFSEPQQIEVNQQNWPLAKCDQSPVSGTPKWFVIAQFLVDVYLDIFDVFFPGYLRPTREVRRLTMI